MVVKTALHDKRRKSKSKTKSKSKSKKSSIDAVVVEEDLDRFAGSSDEEQQEAEEEHEGHAGDHPVDFDADVEGDDDYEEEEDDLENGHHNDDDDKQQQKKKAVSWHAIKDSRRRSQDERRTVDDDTDDDDDDDDDSSLDGAGEGGLMVDPAAKMASVVGRILGSTTVKSTKYQNKQTRTGSDHVSSISSKGQITGTGTSTGVVVLGKTTTPLQKQQQKEKQQLKALKEKRKAHRERNLTALHMPLTIATTTMTATTSSTPGSSSSSPHKIRKSIATELEQERFHRRVATRGVVALFNAITQHQKGTTIDGGAGAGSKTTKVDDRKKDTGSGDTSSKVTKHSFLDQIKSAAATKKTKTTKDDVDQNNNDLSRNDKVDGISPTTAKKKWNALTDDFMMGKSKKNWDEESSEEENDGIDGDDEIPALQDTDANAMTITNKKKKQRIS